MTLIIIGGGIAGLTAGIYAQKNGFDSILLEKHSVTGGECTGWDRKGYHIDGCIHWMTGTKSGSALNSLWVETGALDGAEIIKPDYFTVYEKKGISLTVWRDIERFKTDMTALSPDDKPAVDSFFAAVSALRTMQVPVRKPPELMNIFELIALGFSMRKILPIMNKYGKISVAEFASRFKSDFLRSFFTDSLRPETQASSLMFMFAAFCYGIADIPRGGSKAVAKRMEEQYVALGGSVRANTQVRKICIENEKVTGVELADGYYIRADFVIPTCDVHVTKELLENRYTFGEYDICDANPTDYMLTSCVYIAFGIRDACKGIPERITFDCEPYTAGVTHIKTAGLKTYTYETFAPEGCTAAVSYIDQDAADCDYWMKLYKNKDAYNKAKTTLAQEVLTRIEKRFPSLAGKIDILDVATPATYHRYTGAYKGSWMTYMPTTRAKAFNYEGKIAGIHNLYVSGQWLQPPGGLPTAVAQGKFVIQRLCADLGKKFTGVQ